MLVIVQKEYHGNFAFLILRIFDLLPLKFENFLKIRLIFNIFFLFLNICKQTFHISDVRIPQKVKSVVI